MTTWMPMNNNTGVPYDDWELMAGGSKAAALNGDDADAGYIRSAVQGVRQSMNVTWPSISVIGNVNWIKAYAKLRGVLGTTNDCTYGVRNASGETVAAANNLPTSYTAYQSGELARPGGGSWGQNDCKNGVTWWHLHNTYQAGGTECRATYAFLVLDYDPPGGGYWMLISSLVAAALGAQLALADMPGIAREVARPDDVGRISIIQPHEYEQALRELKEHPYRVYGI